MPNSNNQITEPAVSPGDRVVVLNQLSWQRLCLIAELTDPHRARSYTVNKLISDKYDALLKDVKAITTLESN